MPTVNLQPGDTFNGTPGDDNVYGSTANDTMYGGEGNDNLRGGDGSDMLYGGEGNDNLEGGTGADYMEGGEGNDTYTVDDKSDVVVEQDGVNGGIDHVKSFIDYVLRPNVENLTLMGTDNLSGGGNEQANTIKGNSGDNSLHGFGGNDNLYGFAGNDVIHGGTGNDVMDGGADIDLVSYKESANGVVVSLAITGNQNTVNPADNQGVTSATSSGIDKITGFENLEGSQFNDILTGDAGANKILGLGGNDTIRGGAGNDDLTGGTGADRFVFENLATNGVDTIRGFTSGTDKLVFSSADGYSASNFIINNTTHQLFYDATGGDPSDAQLLANFSPVTITAGDIEIT